MQQILRRTPSGRQSYLTGHTIHAPAHRGTRNPATARRTAMPTVQTQSSANRRSDHRRGPRRGGMPSIKAHRGSERLDKVLPGRRERPIPRFHGRRLRRCSRFASMSAHTPHASDTAPGTRAPSRSHTSQAGEKRKKPPRPREPPRPGNPMAARIQRERGPSPGAQRGHRLMMPTPGGRASAAVEKLQGTDACVGCAGGGTVTAGAVLVQHRGGKGGGEGKVCFPRSPREVTLLWGQAPVSKGLTVAYVLRLGNRATRLSFP